MSADRICKHHGALRCSECFEVNELNKELEVLRGQLKDADEVIEFYANTSHYGVDQAGQSTAIDPCDHEDFFHQEIGISTRGGRRAREYQAKYKSTTCEWLTSKK